ncbi:Glycosyl hydrolase, BNR repeat protein [Labilithrix luteola]|uniref:Glycosyl hydrolase, BNR repeat protein n=1 Tax=Labilithrix luteola TaxID=1391654 RepID=A0A0K1Q279_9BACT|nr:Glycosyl hydrolase, BNR repeat protein [Labilithrix luteola]
MLLSSSLAGLLALALVHCSADGAEPSETHDSGTPSFVDAADDARAVSPDAAPDVSDAGREDVDVPDAGNCSADGWCRTQLPTDGVDLTAVWSFASNDAIAATASQLIHWDGAAWSAVDAPDAEGLTSLWATTPNDLWGVAQYGYRLVHGTRAAIGEPFAWSRIDFDPGTSPSLEVIRGDGPNDLWIYGTRFGSHYLRHGVLSVPPDAPGAGPTLKWTTIPINDSSFRILNSFWPMADKSVWIAGMMSGDLFGSGVVLRGAPTDIANKYSWSQLLTTANAGSAALDAVWQASSGPIWTIGAGGTNFRGVADTDGSVQWTEVPSNATTSMRGIWGSSESDVWVVGRAGAVRHWDGTSWKISRLAVGDKPMWRDLNAVHGGPAGDIWAVGTGVALHRVSSTTGGAP